MVMTIAQNIGKKMNQNSFTYNLRDLNDGGDFDPALLRSIFQSIAKKSLPVELWEQMCQYCNICHHSCSLLLFCHHYSVNWIHYHHCSPCDLWCPKPFKVIWLFSICIHAIDFLRPVWSMMPFCNLYLIEWW